MPGLVFLSTPPSSSSSSSSSSSTPSVSHTPSFCIRTPAPLSLPWPPSLTMTPLSPKAWPSPGGATTSVGLRVLYQDIYGTGAAPAQSDAFELHTWHVSQACQKQLSPTPTSRSPSPSPPFRSLTCDSMRLNLSLCRVVNKLLSSPITACETPSSYRRGAHRRPHLPRT
ncbi:hypothetical protein CABS01_07548 [Colletotrichum abscissum]|uniref:Uncharacterized protein n=1 Tax=Colletotrichum abscissum TaxID=1671311 RepID=A0A9P9XQK1_9PEZI|nr:uncharacterized protein CABS01_07548 [Colletotrichum abscissum]KAI3558505.1 hypothetical protein CABS02_01120 [Colletotrichum abscissum]KAK1511590.1 hypothetical protein CABS01_07548 [Colletotrichum abscissum]